MSGTDPHSREPALRASRPWHLRHRRCIGNLQTPPGRGSLPLSLSGILLLLPLLTPDAAGDGESGGAGDHHNQVGMRIRTIKRRK